MLSILANPRYTGRQVWNKQSKAEVLIDPHNVGLGTRTIMRWNHRDSWVTSRQAAHPALVSETDFERAQQAHAVAGIPRSYLMRGLLVCGICGRRMEGAWNNGRANYRCHHRRGSGPESPHSLSVREDRIVPHLSALLLRAIADESGVAFEDIDLPRDLPGQVALCRSLGLHLIYDHQARTVTTHGRSGPIVVLDR